MVTSRALALMALAALAGCLSTPPSGVITCNNSCPISGYYCAGDGYCWANGEYPSLPSTSSSTSAGETSSGTAGETSSSGTAGTETTGGNTGSSGTSGLGTGKTSTGGSSTGAAKASTGTSGH